MLNIAKKKPSMPFLRFSRPNAICVSWYCFFLFGVCFFYLCHETLLILLSIFHHYILHRLHFSLKTFPKGWILTNKRVFVLPQEVKEFRAFSRGLVGQWSHITLLSVPLAVLLWSKVIQHKITRMPVFILFYNFDFKMIFYYVFGAFNDFFTLR